MAAVSPLAPERFPDLASLAGVRLATAHCGIRYPGRRDLMLAVIEPGATIAGVLTRSATPGAPVDWCRKALKRGKARAIVVNSGNANVFTGRAGRVAVAKTAAALARLLDCDASETYVSSTGVSAEKFVTIRVKGAASDVAARRIGLAIGNSPLVKTAIAAGDANWGRIVMAVGKAGEKADRDRLSIAVGGVKIAAKGDAVPGYDEAPVARHMAGRDIEIAVDLGIGRGRWTVWSCDLTHRYIDINGSYRS